MDTNIVAYFNGKYLPLDKIHISPFDRGYMFADGIYEVIPVWNNHAFGLAEHIQRLNKSLTAIDLTIIEPINWQKIIENLIQHNSDAQGKDLSIYIQVTRGVRIPREHSVPDNLTPQILVTSQTISPAKKYLSAITLEDIRWGRCDIKSIALLASSMLKQQAQARGADDAILIKDGYVTESTSSNVFVVKNNSVYTPPASCKILSGITRYKVMQLLLTHNIKCIEQEITTEFLLQADEIWLTSSTKEIVAINKLNNSSINSNQNYPLYQEASKLLQESKRA
jgi:D-alanine transaminase